MPFLRVIRDKRGYETTYLMHWFQDFGRQRSKILYAFRSPSGTRVGRDAIDPGLMRQLEVQNPGIAFDWKAVLAERQVIEPSPELRRRRPKRGEEAKAAAPPPAAPAPKPEPAAPAPPRPMIPAAIEGLTPEDRLAFLQHWYPIVRERVDRRASDPDRHTALLSLAERMNPEGWAPEEMETRLQQAGEALERLSHVFARRRRRARRKGPGDEAPPPPATTTPESS
ncbi:MAG TPA: hypothetical protein VFD69_19470 [Vicinamibacterales bacterium]|nr:hypothetical protein [Vicinamibacterales bacterium]